MENAIPVSGSTDSSAGRFAEPVIVVSDIHLRRSGPWRARAERLRGIWVGARTAVFNGDTVDPVGAADLDGARQVLSHISGLSEEDGVQAVFLSGNADYRVAARQHVLLAGGHVLVTHGCVLFPEISPWDLGSAALGAARASALGKLGPERRRKLEGQLLSVREALSAVFEERHQRHQHFTRIGDRGIRWLMPRAWAAWRTLRAWRQAPSLALEFLREYVPDAKCLVMGHTHWAGLWQGEGRIAVNTGSFIGPSKPWAVGVDGHRMTVRKVEHDGNDYVLGKEVGRFRL